MKKMKMKILGSASLALLGVGAIASIPIIMTSCAKKTSLSSINFNKEVGDIAFVPGTYEGTLDTLHRRFVYNNKDIISDFAGIDMYFDGSCNSESSLSVWLHATSGCKKYKGDVEVKLHGEYNYGINTVPVFAFTGYSTFKFNIGLPTTVDNQPEPYKYNQPAPTSSNLTGKTPEFDFFGQFPNVTYFNETANNNNVIDGGFDVLEASPASKPAQGTFGVFVLIINDQSSAVEGWNMYFFHWTHL